MPKFLALRTWKDGIPFLWEGEDIERNRFGREYQEFSFGYAESEMPLVIQRYQAVGYEFIAKREGPGQSYKFKSHQWAYDTEHETAYIT